jgi:hypothetical protein
VANKEAKKDSFVSHSLADRPTTRLSDASMREKVAGIRAKLQSDPTFARNLLREAGIVTPKGKLSRKSGG